MSCWNKPEHEAGADHNCDPRSARASALHLSVWLQWSLADPGSALRASCVYGPLTVVGTQQIKLYNYTLIQGSWIAAINK